MKQKITESNVQELYGEASAQYGRLLSYRQSLEQTWRDCSALTLPYIFPDESNSESNVLPTPYNSIGASAVQTLSSKLLLSLLPFTNSFFRLLPYEEDLEGLEEEVMLKIDKELAAVERQIIGLVDTQGLRIPLYEALKFLIITGNTLIFKVPNGGIKVFSPYQYVVERDYVGNVLKIVIKEKMSITSLPEEVQAIYSNANYSPESTEMKEGVDVYTVILKTDTNSFVSYQETDDTIIPNTLKKYKEDVMPYIPLRWTSINNENYGRGLVELFLGDLRSLEGSTQMINEGTATAAKVVFGLKPGSTTKMEDFDNAHNGDVIYGDVEKDISVSKVDKNNDFSISFNLMEKLEQRLSQAFLLLSGNIRNSERTTATEVRATTAELEAALGGTYSVLAAELQIPLVKILINEIDPKYSDITQPSIITGVSAISREKDYENYNTMLGTVAQFGPEAVNKYVNVPGFLLGIANSLGINPDDMINSPEVIAAKEQAEQQAQQPATGTPGLPPQQ